MLLSIPASALAKLWPNASADLRAGMVSTSARVLPQYGIITLLDLTDFLAQLSEETGGGIALIENLNYSAQRLMQVWPSRFPSLDYAQKYGNNPRALANNVYAGREGNVSESDDGFTFRGRGLIQLTFRNNYETIGKMTGLDLLNHPELASNPMYALECAAASWKHAGVSAYANAGDFEGETKRINGGLINLAHRVAWKKLWTAALSIENTAPPASAPPSTIPASPPLIKIPVAWPWIALGVAVAVAVGVGLWLYLR